METYHLRVAKESENPKDNFHVLEMGLSSEQWERVFKAILGALGKRPKRRRKGAAEKP